MAKLPDHERHHSPEACKANVDAVRDALYALNGKWKFPLMVVLSNGPQRFKDIQRTLEGITPKILSKELKELELNEFVKRNVFSTTPVTVTYELTPYSRTLDSVLRELGIWGKEHREHIKRSMKAKPVKQAEFIEED